MRIRLGLALAAALFVPTANAAPTAPYRVDTTEAPLADGARWSAIVPPNWNGVLLLHSRGYAAQAGSPEPAPQRYRAALLDAGFALAASNYGAGGWSVAEAIPAQERTVAAFARRYGKPRRVIGYGFSMGGLVTAALAERRQPAIDGAVAFCGSIGGSLAMMNMGLDGAFAFRTLIAPDAGIQLVAITDDRANAEKVAAATQRARQSPEGRARLILAATLAGIPAWVQPRPGESDQERTAREAEALIAAFPGGVFLPRAEQEQRAGGVFSWNTGVDYFRQLRKSGREEFVRQFYRKAGLDLDADLAALDAQRVSASASAVDYMAAHYVPTASPAVPLLVVQALGDTVTSPSLQQGYAAAAPARMVQSLYLAQGGHCQFSPNQLVDAIARMQHRLDTGRWRAPGPTYNSAQPAPLLRPCFQGDRCPGRSIARANAPA